MVAVLLSWKTIMSNVTSCENALFAIYTSPIIHLVCSPKICITLFFLFLLGITVVPRKIKDNAYAKFGGQTRCIMGDVKIG